MHCYGDGSFWNGVCQEHFQVSKYLLWMICNRRRTYHLSPRDRCRFSAANWFTCGLETLLLGGACATVAYTIGQFVDKLIAE